MPKVVDHEIRLADGRRAHFPLTDWVDVRERFRPGEVIAVHEIERRRGRTAARLLDLVIYAVAGSGDGRRQRIVLHGPGPRQSLDVPAALCGFDRPITAIHLAPGELIAVATDSCDVEVFMLAKVAPRT